MNNQNFYLRLITLLMIIMAVFFYNGTVKDKEQEQSITDLTTQVQNLQDQQEQILTALQEAYEEQKTVAESKTESDSKSSDSKKVQLPKKHLMILTMYTKTVHMKAPVQDTAELSLCR